MNGYSYSRYAGWCRDDGNGLVKLDPELKHGLIPGFPEAKFQHPYPAGRSPVKWEGPQQGERIAPPVEVLEGSGIEAVPAGNPRQRFQEDYVPTAGWPLVFAPQPALNV